MPGWAKRAIVWFWVAALGAFYALGVMRALRNLLLAIVVSLFLSFALEPAVNRLEKRGIRRGLGTGIVFAGAVGVIIGIVSAVANALATQIQDLTGKAPGYIDDFQDWANSTFSAFNLNIDFDTLRQEFVDGGGVQNLLGRFADDVVNLGTTMVSVLLQLFTVALFTFYLVAEGPKFRRLVSSALPEKRREAVLEVWDLAIEKTGGYIYSRTVLAAISAALHWLVFTLLGVPSPLALALWVGVVSQFVPAVGTYIAGALPVAIALLNSPRTGLWVLIAIIVYQQVENYLLSPRITARTMDVHVAVAFGSVLAGIALQGVVGGLLALPFAATVQALISSWRARGGWSTAEAADAPAEAEATSTEEP